jgi:hypothetical protein
MDESQAAVDDAALVREIATIRATLAEAGVGHDVNKADLEKMALELREIGANLRTYAARRAKRTPVAPLDEPATGEQPATS